MKPDQKFNVKAVEKIIENVLKEQLEEEKYDAKASKQVLNRNREGNRNGSSNEMRRRGREEAKKAVLYRKKRWMVIIFHCCSPLLSFIDGFWKERREDCTGSAVSIGKLHIMFLIISLHRCPRHCLRL